LNNPAITPLERFLATLHIVAKESQHLEWSQQRLFGETIDRAWVESLPGRPDLAERLEAFVSRYGRLQDTLGEKLLPRWLLALAEQPGSLIEVLNRAERLGVVKDVSTWLEARQLRNRLVHEYMTDSAAFAEDLRLAEAYSRMLIETYRRVRQDAITRLGIPEDRLPAA
jgi:hypothetical protein